MPESHTPGEQSEASRTTLSVAQLMEALRRPHMGMLLVLFFMVTFGFANIYATFPLISTREFGFTEREVGYLFGFIGIIGAITQGGLIRPLSERFDERWLFFVGTVLTMAGLIALPFYVSTPVLLLELAVMSLGTGIMTPAVLSLISRAADAHEQGGILGVNQALGSLGRVLGPVWGAYVFQVFGVSWPFLTGGIVMAVVALLIRQRLWLSHTPGEVQA
jgi:predicted MFS family arabinose efflux permease